MIRRALANVRERLDEDGLALRTYRNARHRLEWLRHERRQAVDTSRHITLEELGVEHPDRNWYEPASWSTLRTVLPKSEVRPTDVFVDFGSGMGRMVQQAATYPFARVIGVEVSEHLNEIARVNFERNRDRFSCKNVAFITCDAVEFPIPDDMSHAYMFNSFKDQTLRNVLQHIFDSIDRAPRKVVLIYDNPLERHVFEETGRFELVDEKQTALRRKALIYESRP